MELFVMSGAWLCSPGRIFTLRNQLCMYNVIMTHWGNQILQYAKIFFMGSITQQKTSFSKFSVIHQSIFVIFAAFSALTLLVGWQEGHPACKKTEWWGYWRGNLSGARCTLAYGPADATATHCLLLQ